MFGIDSIVERMLPEYRVRHIFATKLRLVAFFGFWAIYLYFLRDVLGQTKGVAALVFASFVFTGFAYANVLRGRYLLPSFALELVCDLTAIAAVLYLTGGPHSPYYTVYLFYVFLAGVLYTYRLAAVVAAASALSYLAFLLLCHAGIIPPLILDYGEHLPIPTYTPAAHFLFAVIFLAGIVYTVKVASFFSQQRERILEQRNRELTALHQMSSTIRSARALPSVIEQLLGGILEGLGFETAVLVRFEWAAEKALLHVPRRTPRLAEIESILGRAIDGAEVPIKALPPLLMQEIARHRMVFRRRLAEVTEGMEGMFSASACDRVQELIGAQRLVVMPIVVEDEVLGALIGFSREPFVEEEHVSTLEAFANQAALSLEAATLIDRLRRLNEALREANLVKSEFLATMSHELRTPLTAIIGFTELLLEGLMGELTEEQQDSLREVLHNAADLLDLINSLLDLTKIESGKMRLEVRPFDLAETFQRVVSTITPLIHRKEQQLEVPLPEGLPALVGDERKIQQTLLNLLANANKFTPQGGRISARMRHVPAHATTPDGWRDLPREEAERFFAGAVEIVVEDDGIGIPPDQQERIFEMFHQVDGSTTRSFGGTGVGLALARQFVEMHGGRIWVESEPGQGARFIIILPLGQRSHSPPEAFPAGEG